MNVLHVVAGNLDEGAAQGAYILHEHLLSHGVQSFILTNSLITDGYKKVRSISEGFSGRMKTTLRMRLDNAHKLIYDTEKIKFSPGLLGYDITKLDIFHEADIIHLHWICNGFVDVKDFRNINKPMIWTLRDMWPMTGGCHYSLHCDRFEQECGKCPHLGSNRKYDLSTMLQQRKKKFYPDQIRFVGISHWISEKARKSSLLGNYKIETILNNIDLSSFFPSQKTEAKNHFNLSIDKPVILFGAQYINSIYKGVDILADVIKKADRNAQLVFFGRDKPDFRNSGLKYSHLGFLNADELRKAYTAADVFVSTSRMEAFGKTVAEAMACGTPVVCFDETGSADIVDHKLNGYLAKPFEAEDIISGITYILEHPEYNALADRAIEKVKSSFDPEILTKEYIRLYEQVSGG